MDGAAFARAAVGIIFAAVCAYLGAALFEGGSLPETAEAVSMTVTDSAQLKGIAVRTEQLVCSVSGFIPAVSDGERVCSGGQLAPGVYSENSAVFFAGTDGYEYLRADFTGDFGADAVERLLDAAPQSTDACGRTVTENAWYYAAVCDGEYQLSGKCSLIFDGMKSPVSACVLRCEAQSGKTALLFRLTAGGEYLKLRKCGAELVFSRQSGLAVPAEAVMHGDDGDFVYTLSAGVAERKFVDIIYSDGERSLAARSEDADALREGSTVIVSLEDIYEGKVIY